MILSFRLSWIGLGILLALASAGHCSARVAQATGSSGQQTDQDGQDTPATPDSSHKKTKLPQGAKAKGNFSKNGGKDAGKEPHATAATPNDDAVAGASGSDKKNTPAGQPSFQDLARKSLQNLDAAIEVAQKSGVLAPAAGPDQAKRDPVVLKRNALKDRADAAGDDQAWAGVANDASAALGDLLKAIATNRHSSPGTAVQPGTGAPSVAPGPDANSPGHSNLAVYLAGLSLLVSALSLWRGWFLARREVNKALVEAGLL